LYTVLDINKKIENRNSIGDKHYNVEKLINDSLLKKDTNFIVENTPSVLL